VSEPDVEKARKKRRRSARFYISMNHPPDPQAVAALAALFPSDADDTGQAAPAKPAARRMAKPETVKRDYSQAERKRLAREGKALVNPDGHVSYPIADEEDLQNAATLARTGHGDVEGARRLIARRAKELGVKNPLESSEKSTMGNPHPGRDYNRDRVSEPLSAGHASPAVGDHGVGQGRNAEIAAHHPDLQQGSTRPAPWFATRTAEGDNQYGDRSITHVAGQVGVSFLDLRGAASPAPEALLPAANPAARRMDHIARDSATPPTPGHPLTDPQSHAAPAAVKGARLGGHAAMEMLRQVARDAIAGPQ